MLETLRLLASGKYRVGYRYVRYGDLSVAYRVRLNGGGLTFGQQFVGAVEQKVGRAEHVFEFCAGPAFIGFSLLAHGLCDRLTLADINPAAIAACNATIDINGLHDRAQAVLADCLDGIEPAQSWDLVVGNPPHFPVPDQAHGSDIHRFDLGLKLHERFFANIRPYLRPGGSILLQENIKATKVDDFAPMIKRNGLTIVETFQLRPQSAFYFIWCRP